MTSHSMSLWRTPEFAAYYGVLGAAAVVGTAACVHLAKTHRAVLRVVPETLLGGWIDVSDHQWNMLRGALPSALLLIVVHAAVGRLLWNSAESRKPGNVARRVSLRAAGALAFMFVMHGFALAYMLVLFAPFLLLSAGRTPRGAVVPLVWTWALAVIVLLRPLERAGVLPAPPLWAGLAPSWTASFNFAVLRMLSVALDRHYARTRDVRFAHDAGRCSDCRAARERRSTHVYASLADVESPTGSETLVTLLPKGSVDQEESLPFSVKETTFSPFSVKENTVSSDRETFSPIAVKETTVFPIRADKETFAPYTAIREEREAPFESIHNAPQPNGHGPEAMPACRRERMSRLPEDTEGAQWTASTAAAVAYVLYAPLAVAGPIVTYSDFCWHVAAPPPLRPLAATALASLANALVAVAALEAACRSVMAFALRDAAVRGALALAPASVAAVGVWGLGLLFLKLAAAWSLFRAGALLDGVAAPENMARFFLNSPSPAGFWRAWHRSFNAWLLRYMYVPLGGRRRALRNAWPIFAFVAVWHEPEAHLLLWAAAIAAFLVPEALAGRVCARLGAAQRLSPTAWRHARAAGVAANLLLMGVANAVGYVLGPRGVLAFLAGLRGRAFLVLPAVYAALFALAHVQLEIRASEARRGIFRPY